MTSLPGQTEPWVDGERLGLTWWPVGLELLFFTPTISLSVGHDLVGWGWGVHEGVEGG